VLETQTPVHFHYLEIVFICQRKTTFYKNSFPWLFVYKSATNQCNTDRYIWIWLRSMLWLIGFYRVAAEKHSEYHIRWCSL